MNRVVVTGYGVTSPIGNDPETFLASLQDVPTASARLQNLTQKQQEF